MIGQVRAGATWQAEKTRLDLAKLGVQLSPVDTDPARKEAVATKLLENSQQSVARVVGVGHLPRHAAATSNSTVGRRRAPSRRHLGPLLSAIVARSAFQLGLTQVVFRR